MGIDYRLGRWRRRNRLPWARLRGLLQDDDQGKVHVSALKAIPEPASLVELRELLEAMVPRVSVPEVILEAMSWQPGFVHAFTSVSGGRTRLADLHVSVAACLSAHAMNIGFDPILNRGVAALERGRISHVDQNYMGAETYRAAKPVPHLWASVVEVVC